MPFANKMAFSPTATPEVMTKRVWYCGNDAVKKGQALVYKFDADVTGVSADRCVCIPATGYDTYFAGVARQDAIAVTGGQFIDIAVPGSTDYCLVGPAGTKGSTVVVMSKTGGKFGLRTTGSEEKGCGTAVMLETVANATEAGVLVKCKLLDGTDCVAPAYNSGASSSSSSSSASI